MQAVNNLRGIAIMMIVFTHANLLMQKVGPASQFIDFVIGNFTIIFIFIAGYLFASQGANFHYPRYLKSKALYVGLPYVILSFPAALSFILGWRDHHAWIDMQWFQTLNPVVQYLYLLVTGAMLGPLWFIPMVLIFYLTAPLFHLLIHRGALTLALIALTLPVAYIVSRPFMNSNPVQSFIFYTPIYLIGIATYRYRAFVPRGQVSAAIAIAYVFVMMAAYLILYTPQHRPVISTQLIYYIPLCFALLILMTHFCDRRIAWLDMFARLSFFIFFVHGYLTGIVRLALREAGVRAATDPLSEVALTLTSGTLFLLLCLAAYIVLKLITGRHSRYLIGG